MLFNSAVFLFLFLPITLLGYYFLGKWGRPRYAIIWLVAASLLFYAWAGPVYLVLISGSILFNYALGLILARSAGRRKLIMASGVAANILLLGYFKYANFFIDNVNAIFGISIPFSTVILPLAISFFTLQQIAFLVDIYRGERQEYGFWEYCLFVLFFPKLLSGPIVRLKEMMPQITRGFKPCLTSQNMAVGLTTLFLGLFKKVIIADHVGAFVAPVFNAAAAGGGDISFFNAWSGALAYTFQLYFDFSAYSDMAIGLGLLFGIKIPLNFYSPYKAKSIIDFWRRWHISLSTFIRDYIYIPLGGNRRGFTLQIVYLLTAMAVAGLWHGAGWTFVIWGALHGAYLAVNHLWRRLRKATGKEGRQGAWWSTAISIFITFIAATVAWVFFRADSVSAAVEILKGMVGIYGFHVPYSDYVALGSIGQVLANIGVDFDRLVALPGFSWMGIIWIAVSLLICWFLPNVQEYMSGYSPSLDSSRFESGKARLSWLRWKPTLLNASFISIIIVLTLLGLSQVTKFIYFGF